MEAPNESEVLEQDWTLEHMEAHILQAQSQIFKAKEILTRIEDGSLFITMKSGSPFEVKKTDECWVLSFSIRGNYYDDKHGHNDAMNIVKRIMVSSMRRSMNLYEMQNYECLS
jgi:hypothetical protein